MAYLRQTLENPASGERITFRQTAAEMAASSSRLTSIQVAVGLPLFRLMRGPESSQQLRDPGIGT